MQAGVGLHRQGRRARQQEGEEGVVVEEEGEGRDKTPATTGPLKTLMSFGARTRSRRRNIMRGRCVGNGIKHVHVVFAL